MAVQAWSIREATLSDVSAIARVDYESHQAAYRGLLPDEALARQSVPAAEAQWTRILTEAGEGKFTLVAVSAEGEVIGYAGCGPPQYEEPKGYDAEVYAIYILSTVQRRGIGRALVRAAVDRFLERGWRSMVIWCLEFNPAIGFYERLGGARVAEREVARTTSALEVAFAWPDLSSF